MLRDWEAPCINRWMVWWVKLQWGRPAPHKLNVVCFWCALLADRRVYMSHIRHVTRQLAWFLDGRTAGLSEDGTYSTVWGSGSWYLLSVHFENELFLIQGSPCLKVFGQGGGKSFRELKLVLFGDLFFLSSGKRHGQLATKSKHNGACSPLPSGGKY